MQQQDADKPKVQDAAVAFIIQNEKEVIPWKKKTPISTSDLNQFIAIKFVSKFGAQKKLSHFVQVVASAETNIGKIRGAIDDENAESKTEVCLAEQELEDVAFTDAAFTQVMVDYSKE